MFYADNCCKCIEEYEPEHTYTFIGKWMDSGEEHKVTDIKHDFDKITKSHLHYKLGEKKCLELLVVDGKADDIKELIRQLQVSGEVDNIKLVRT